MEYGAHVLCRECHGSVDVSLRGQAAGPQTVIAERYEEGSLQRVVDDEIAMLDTDKPDGAGGPQSSLTEHKVLMLLGRRGRLVGSNR